MDRKPNVNNMGVSNVIDPFHMVPTQLKNFTPWVPQMSIVMKAKKGSSTAPVTYMVGPHRHRQTCDGCVAKTRPL